MVETVKRFRETGAWVVLVGSAVYIVLSLIDFGNQLAHDAGLASAARSIGGSSLSVVMVLALLAVVLTCVLVRPVTPHARALLRLAAIVVTLAAALESVFLILGLTSGRGGGFIGAVLEVMGAFVEIGVKSAAAVVLWRAVRGAPEPEPALEASTHQPEAAEPTTSASWSAEEAAGAVWTRAGDAASGAAANTWGVPGKHTNGWDIAAAQAELEAPTTRSAKGPWATAGQLAEGDAVAQLPAASPQAEAAPGGVQWTPANRGE